jgi:two-component system, LytTR family, response regulator
LWAKTYFMLKVAIIEDEEKTASHLQTILNEYCNEVELVGVASSIEAAVTLLNSVAVDLVLSDINLPDGNSFAIFERLENIDFKIIFITAFEEYALKAIKFSAFDYLMKPIDPLELIAAIRKAQKQLEKEHAAIKMEALLTNVRDFSEHLKKIVLKTSESIYIIDVQDIISCESDSSYTKFALLDGRKIMVSRVLKEYDEMLNGSGFFRVHKSHLVNINHIDRFNKTEGGYLVMKDGSNIPVSQRKREKIISLLESL